jgi:hypothetical protein
MNICSLAHIEHYCHNEGRIILNFHKFKFWFTQYKELAVSTWNPNRFDHLGQSMTFLRDFSIYNSDKIEGLVTHKTYNWSEKEKTEEGSPLKDIIRQGIHFLETT